MAVVGSGTAAGVASAWAIWEQQAEVEIDIEPHILAVDDTVLLCSRGVWSAVAEHELE